MTPKMAFISRDIYESQSISTRPYRYDLKMTHQVHYLEIRCHFEMFVLLILLHYFNPFFFILSENEQVTDFLFSA